MNFSSYQRYSFIAEIMAFVKENCIIEFQDLFDYARFEKSDTWFPLLCDNSAYVLKLYVRSQRHRLSSPIK